MQGTTPQAPTGPLSPDGYWRWDGARWVPASPAGPPAGGVQQFVPSPPPLAAAPVARRSWLTLTGAGLALAGAVVTFVACLLPYGQYSDGSGGTMTSSIFNGGYPGSWSSSVEPLAVILIVLGAAVLAFVSTGRTALAASSAAIAVLGVESLMMWFGYVVVAGANGSVEPGGVVGMLASLILVTAGILTGVGMLTRHAGA